MHGMASHLKQGQSNDDALVFSLPEYARSGANPKVWHRVFSDQFEGTPFLVIGASLSEEIDLAEVLQRGSAAYRSTGYPSIVEHPSISALRRDQVEAAGLTVVEEKGEDLLRATIECFRSARSKYDEVYGGGTPVSRKFLQQFIDLRKFEPNSQSTQEFYSGYQPTWRTILDHDDVTLDKTKEPSRFNLSRNLQEKKLIKR